MKKDTRLTHAGLDPHANHGVVNPPVYHASTILYPTVEALEKAVKDAGGTIVKEIFSFPGGRRFQFTDPSGNELAVWSEK